MIFMSSCGMMFKNKPTHTKIVNNSNYNIEILNHNSNIIKHIMIILIVNIFKFSFYFVF